jgi:hypothetical protein
MALLPYQDGQHMHIAGRNKAGSRQYFDTTARALRLRNPSVILQRNTLSEACGDRPAEEHDFSTRSST